MRKMLLCFGALVAIVVASAETIDIDGVTWTYYKRTDNKIRIDDFSPKTIEKLDIPASIEGCPVADLDDLFHFRDCSNLKSVMIPASLTDGFHKLWICPALEHIEVDPANEHYVSIDDVLYERTDSGLSLITIPRKKTGTLVVASEVDSVWGLYYFSGLDGGASPLSRIDFEGQPPSSAVYLSAAYFSSVEIRYNAIYAEEWQKVLSGVALAKSYSPDATMEDGGPYIQVIEGVEWHFSVSNGQVIVGGGTSGPSAISATVAGVIQIPEMIGGCPVMHIGDYAFCGCDNVESFSLPKYVRTIGSYAFANCRALSGVTLPEGLQRIGDYAFYQGMKWTEDVPFLIPVLPDSVTHIGDGAFEHCTASTSTLILPKSLVECGNYSFGDCNGLKRVVFPDTLKKLGYVDTFESGRGVYVFEGNPPESIDSQGYPSATYPSFSGSGIVVMYSVWNHSEWEYRYNCCDRMPDNIVKYVPEMSDASGSSVSACSLTVTNVVVQYVLNSVRPEFAVPVSSDTGFVNIIAEIKTGGALSIPSSWAENYPEFVSKFGGDFTAALGKRTGKIGADGTPMLVWQDYVAGTDPTKEKDVFQASISIVDGKVKISYTPELDEARKALRKYTTWGKQRLQDVSWTEVKDGQEGNFNFFKVSVEMR